MPQNLSRLSFPRIILTIAVILALSFKALAFHIVGGEIELLHLNDFNYRINVIQYFDRAQTFNPGPESQIFVFTYRVTDRELMRIDTLFLTSQDPVLYTNPECAIAQLNTEKVLFTRDVTLDPEQFSDPEGYFLVWERCCRNGTVVNISNPLSTGMTYALQIPPIVKDGQPFVNSSPSLFPPLSDFACVDELYYVDFAGIDVDGDQIIYSLSEPLNSSSTVALPIPQYPDPDRKVVWVPGIDNSNIVPGSPPLNISSEGFITVRPSDPGLHVFAVLAEEFRDGVKIGEVRRDFQLLVIDGCTPGNSPVVNATRPDNGQPYIEGDVISFTANEDKCFQFMVRDSDGEENVTLKALGVNFNQDVSELFSFNTATIVGSEDELQVEVCIPDCPFIPGDTFLIDFIAMDDACPLPRMDTLRMSFFVEPPPNTTPTWNDPDNSIVIGIPEGGSASQVISGVDADGDSLDIFILNEGFDPAQFGMTISPVFSSTGGIDVGYELDGNCLEHDFGLQNEFQLQLALEDRDECRVNNADILNLDVTVDLPPNTDPVVSTSTGQTMVEVSFDELIDLEVFATDADGDTVILNAVVEEFELDDLGISFEADSGISNASSRFSWQFDCESIDLMGKEEFTVNFIATDQDKCKVPNADTLALTVKLLIPFNNPPTLSGDVDGEPLTDGDVIDAKVLAPLDLPLVGQDMDGDIVSLSLLPDSEVPSESFMFDPIRGAGEVSANIDWIPECSLLQSDGSPSEFDVAFLLTDNSCPDPKSDTLFLTLRVFDAPVTFNEFEPPNVVTPNGDQLNDVFSLSGHEKASFNLPPDSCDDIFQNVTIVNRYGKPVFESEDRNFVWRAIDETAGIYYYNLNYTNTEFRGTVTLLE